MKIDIFMLFLSLHLFINASANGYLLIVLSIDVFLGDSHGQ
jgi:hypothetical protein